MHNLTGSTTVIGWDRDSVALSGTVPPGAAFFFGGSARGVKGGVELADPADTTPAVIQLRVPRGARVWIKSATGNITARGLTGGLDLYTVSGTIVVEGPAAELQAEAMDGEVTVDAARWTRVKTASGAVTVSGGEDVGISSVTGTVRYTGDLFRRARLESVSGDLAFRGDVPRGARLEMESHSGTTTLDLPDDVFATFTITTFQGTVSNAFGPETLQPATDGRGRVLEFMTGEGADVTIRSFKGDVTLKRTVEVGRGR
jgi:hypothetical protein